MEGPEGKEENYGTLYQMLHGNGGGEAIKHLSICLFLYAIRLTDIPRSKVLLRVAFLKKDENKTNLTIPSKDNNIITPTIQQIFFLAHFYHHHVWISWPKTLQLRCEKEPSAVNFMPCTYWKGWHKGCPFRGAPPHIKWQSSHHN